MAKADFEKAARLYPSVYMDEQGWIEVFNQNQDIMWAIVGDIYDAVKTEQEKDAGIRRMGRRPARQATSMDEVYATVFPQQYSMDPFPTAFAKLIDGRSQRAFAMKIPCSQGTISRLLSGQMAPDLTMLERIAAAGKVPPYFFVEYRALLVGQMVTQVLLAQPNMGVTAMKRIRAGRRQLQGAR